MWWLNDCFFCDLIKMNERQTCTLDLEYRYAFDNAKVLNLIFQNIFL